MDLDKLTIASSFGFKHQNDTASPINMAHFKLQKQFIITQIII